MTQETLWPVHDGSSHRKPWSRTRAVLDVLARPVWTERDRNRMDHVASLMDREESHTCMKGTDDDFGPEWDGPCRVCDLIGKIDLAVKEWDRIRQAPPIPSTAQLRNAIRRPDNAVRAARLYRDLKERRIERYRAVVASVKPYKTDRARWKHERIALESDPVMRRLDRAIARLEWIRRDVEYLARTVR